VVTPAFDGEHSAAKWLVRPAEIFGGKTPLSLLQSGDGQAKQVLAVLDRFDGIRIG